MSVRLEFNAEAFAQIRKAPGVLADVRRRAEAVATRAGDGYEAEADLESNRASAAAFTNTAEARAENARNHTLINALDAGRG